MLLRSTSELEESTGQRWGQKLRPKLKTLTYKQKLITSAHWLWRTPKSSDLWKQDSRSWEHRWGKKQNSSASAIMIRFFFLSPTCGQAGSLFWLPRLCHCLCLEKAFSCLCSRQPVSLIYFSQLTSWCFTSNPPFPHFYRWGNCDLIKVTHLVKG